MLGLGVSEPKTGLSVSAPAPNLTVKADPYNTSLPSLSLASSSSLEPRISPSATSSAPQLPVRSRPRRPVLKWRDESEKALAANTIVQCMSKSYGSQNAMEHAQKITIEIRNSINAISSGSTIHTVSVSQDLHGNADSRPTPFSVHVNLSTHPDMSIPVPPALHHTRASHMTPPPSNLKRVKLDHNRPSPEQPSVNTHDIINRRRGEAEYHGSSTPMSSQAGYWVADSMELDTSSSGEEHPMEEKAENFSAANHAVHASCSKTILPSMVIYTEPDNPVKPASTAQANSNEPASPDAPIASIAPANSDALLPAVLQQIPTRLPPALLPQI